MAGKEKQTKKPGKGTLGKIFLYMKPMWGYFAAICVLSFTGSALGLMAPTFMKNIVNEIQKGLSGQMDPDVIIHAAVMSAVILGLGFLCNLITSQLTPTLTQRTAERMRRDINEKANRIPLNYFDTNPEGETLSTMVNDVDTLATSFGNTLPQILGAVVSFVGCLVLMFATSPLLAVTTIAASAAGLVITILLMAKGAPYFAKNQAGLAKINAQINEDIKGHLVIKSFGAEQEVLDDFHRSSEEIYDSSMKSQFVNSLIPPVSNFASNLGYFAVCVVGAALAFSGKATIGTIVAFIQYAQLFSGPLGTLAQAGGNLQPAVAAGDRIFALLEQEEMRDEGKTKVDPETVKGTVDFEHVKFGYVPGSIIVHDFSLRVKPGQKVAIVGPTGAGKSTLVNLLMRFYELNGGNIKIDGVPITEMSRETLHSLISMVLQDTWTFEGTIRDNIVYAKQDVTEEQLMKVCDETGLTGFFKAFPGGIDTVLGEESGISAGQKQLITIARAMLEDAPLLILDEATSSVDTRTEKIISQAVDKLMEGRTSFVIAHRLSTIRNADAILVLKDGDIIEIGTHDELMKKQGFYADLYMSQFDNRGQQAS